MGPQEALGVPEEPDRAQDGAEESDRLSRTQKQLRDVLIIVAMLVAITVLHQFTNRHPAYAGLHEIYLRLYYVPILYAAFVFGMRGGLATAIASAVLYGAYNFSGAFPFLGLPLDNLLEIGLFFVMGGLFGHLRDLEKRRTRDLVQVSSKLEDAYGALEERAMQLITVQEHTQSILRSLSTAVLTVGPEGLVETANPAAERILGMREARMTERAIASLFKDPAGLTGDVDKVLGGRVPRTMRDLTLVTEGGKLVHAQASVSRMRDVGGRKLGAVVTIEDVSDIRMLTEQLIRADRLAAMGELTAGVAHEVRNPLGIIRASVQLMEDSQSSAERVHAAGEVIKQEIDRLDRVVKALLDFGRPAQPSLRPVAVRHVLQEVALFSRPSATRSKVRIVEDYATGIPDVMADPEQLKQVFVNLISNAVQAMTGQGGILTITTGASEGFVFVRFSDTGPGIAADVLSKIFDPFVSTRDDGTGLGLTIVHRIVDDHDGHIEVATDPAAGSAFTVWLPALQ